MSCEGVRLGGPSVTTVEIPSASGGVFRVTEEAQTSHPGRSHQPERRPVLLRRALGGYLQEVGSSSLDPPPSPGGPGAGRELVLKPRAAMKDAVIGDQKPGVRTPV